MDSSELKDLYRIRFEEEGLERKNAIWQVLCRDFFQKFIRPQDTVVDIACGYGEFINNISAGRRIGVDLNSDSRDFLGEGVEFHLENALSLSNIVDGEADVVFTSNFLEHLPDKPTLNSLFEQIHSALKPGGRYLILGPNLRYLPGKYWDFYDHDLGLTHLSLIEALEMQGFSIELCYDRFLPFTTKSALPTHPFHVQCYLRIPLVWRVLGRQFFVVAKKTQSGNG